MEDTVEKENIIEFKNISKTFQLKNSEVQALKDVSISVRKGDIFGVIGFSGAGKSTLVRMVNALEKPTSGTVTVKGKNVLELKGRELRSFRKNIGMIFQHFNLLESRTVFQNIAIPLELASSKLPFKGTAKKEQGKLWSRQEIRERVEELLDFVELKDKAQAYPSQLSGGQKQRIGIARALALNPEILLCDEATSALDPRTTDSILELLQKINQRLNITILMITHQMNVIQKVCNKVAVLEKGTLVESGSVSEVFGNPKKETTKGFIRTIINDRLPESVKEYLRNYKEPQRVVRLRFDGKNADEPVMSLAIKETGVNISVLYGTVTELEGKITGFQTVQITGTESQIDAAEKFFAEHKVPATKVEI
ncbi:ATP-binding cassette domain-containing protein [uncultured Treponema sp.]|uniref:methionine ABC transporter ATP-binding protein n=1 Tax=uncultured Treponema sp. TaxID=162155 RepID=UPI00280B09FA|nr:ATP-binding cassette domain-containing protein [uncultured Treponema sp.]